MIKIKLKPSEEYIFSLFDINLIDFDNIDFDNDDVISLPLIKSKVPIITDNLDDDMCLFINDTILDGDMWLTYNVIDHKVEMFVAECHAVQSTTEIANIIFLMEQHQSPEYEKYKTAYDNFNALVKERLKQQIRKMMTDVKGEFVKDTFKEDTYFQFRTDKQKDIYYTIYRWWEKLINGEVNFTDIDNGEGAVFVALNNWH